VHLQTPAVDSVLKTGLQVISQDALPFFEAVASCGSEEEIEKGIRAMAPKEPTVVMVKGKAAYVVGRDEGAALVLAFYLNHVCQVQLLLGTRAVIKPDRHVFLGSQCDSGSDFEPGVEWPAVVSWLQGQAPPSPQHAPSQSRDLRKELVTAHQDVVTRGWDQLIWNHISAKLEEGFLITPGDRMWAQIDEASLKVSSSNVTADVLHSAVYTYTENKAIVHLHTKAVQAVSCLEEGLRVDAGSEFDGKVAYHDWEGISDDTDECPRVGHAISAVKDCCVLILRNHGAITFGASVTEAYDRYVRLDAACHAQLRPGKRKGGD